MEDYLVGVESACGFQRVSGIIDYSRSSKLVCGFKQSCVQSQSFRGRSFLLLSTMIEKLKDVFLTEWKVACYMSPFSKLGKLWLFLSTLLLCVRASRMELAS